MSAIDVLRSLRSRGSINKLVAMDAAVVGLGVGVGAEFADGVANYDSEEDRPSLLDELDADVDDDETQLLPKELQKRLLSFPSVFHRLKLALMTVPRHIWALVSLTLLLTIDRASRPPHGLFPLRSFTGTGTRVNTPCGWDYEASWKIGVGRGTSPLTISVEHASSQYNPVLTCASVSGVNASFVADPFLAMTISMVVNDGHTVIRPVSMSITPSSTPAHTRTVTNGSQYYVFYELKNLATGLGDIGVSVSDDGGQSFDYVGVVLSEPGIHLSYPIIFYEQHSDRWLMIPESSASLSVRLYTTTARSFPYQWTLHSVPLTGQRFVDVSPIYYHRQWHIFITYDDCLHLYVSRSPSLLDSQSQWVEHPLSPLVKNDRRYARSAGRPFLYDGLIHRIAQDDTTFYGSKIYIIAIERLSATQYEERVVRVLEPSAFHGQSSEWASQRLHHFDAHYLADTHQWIALIDGDDKPDDYQYYRREGWFRTVKMIVLVVLLTITVIAVLRHYRTNNVIKSLRRWSLFSWRQWVVMRSPSLPHPRSLTITRSLPFSSHLTCLNLWRAIQFLITGIIVFAFVILVASVHYPVCSDGVSGMAYRLHSSVNAIEEAEAALPMPVSPNVLARFGSVSLSDADTLTFPHNSANYSLPLSSLRSQSLPSSSLSSLSYYSLPGFILLTGASSSYFDRLQNFVGSLHYWEPSQSLIVYDLGLTADQANEVRCWQRVELRPFPFDRYPQHVRNLYNYGWKTLLLDDAFHYYDSNISAVLVLDSGVELRRPFALSSIKATIVERGYWFALQSNTVDKKTMAETLNRLGIDVAAVTGQPFCAGGLNGFLRASPAYNEIVVPAIECALDEHCIAPVGSGRKTHNFDQSVLSSLVYHTGRRCSPHREYREWDMSLVTDDETNYNSIVLSLRRWHQPKPYIRHIQQRINHQCKFVPALKRASIDWPPEPPIDVLGLDYTNATVIASIESILIQHKDGQHLESSSPLVQCLLRHNNSRLPCRKELHRHENAIVALDSAEMTSLRTMIDSEGFRIVRRIRCLNHWILTITLTVALWLTVHLYRQSQRKLRFLLIAFTVIAIIAVYPLYLSLLNEFGTFSPLIVMLKMKTHSVDSRANQQSSTASLLLPSSPSQSRSLPRVVFTMSTLPHQVEFINETLDSLSAQSLKPDTIYINLPLVNHRTGEAYHPPSFLLTGQWRGVPLVVNRGEDIGPLTKLAPTLLVETGADTIIITCDTDKRYPSTLARSLVQHSAADPSTAYGVCGWGFLFRPAPVGVLPIYVPWALRGRHGRVVDVLQAVCGNAYRRSMFPPVDSAEMQLFMTPHPACFTTDDLWIAGWLATRSGTRPVPNVIIPGGWTMWSDESPEPVTAEWKSRVSKGWDLSSINKAAGIDMACLRGVEQSLGPWRERREGQGGAANFN